MSGGLNKKFIAEKAAFLQDYFLIWKGDQTLNAKGVYSFDIMRDKATRITNSAGKSMKACTLTTMTGRGKAVGSDTNDILGYYVPYGHNEAFHHRLVDNVDFCFTPTLNGCTFVVGSGATPLVSHYNYQTGPVDAPTIDQAKIDQRINNRYGGNYTALRRGNYKLGPRMEYKATIVGIREGDGWHFYYQRRSQDMVHVPGQGSSLVTIAENQSVQLT